MSTTIEQQVVEMRFDNRNFQQNISETLSTLERFKQKLRLDGATKGLEDVNRATKGVDMSGLGRSVETVSAKFSALQVMGVTALANITNSAVNAGKRMISALTIDPIKTGFQEYETQMNAVQTILANTQSKGSTLKDVNKALDELNTYADKTIYNFTEMTRNIGTFTAAGIDLNTSVNAIQGIANLAAVSGSTSQQASTAMYQLSQALASGTVKLMDWNSVVNAGMGGQVFQDALKATSKELGTGAEAAIKASGSFRESLKDGWLTAEVLTATLKKFTTSGANEYVAKYTGLSVEAVQAALDEAKARYGEADAIEKASQALAEKSGKNKEEIKTALQFAKTAEDAATKVKTFTQLWDVMKESAQSGWAQTWKLLVGDFEQARSLLTPLADFLTKIIGKFSDARNDLLKSALGRSFSDLSKKINTVLEPAKKASKTITTVTDSVKDLGVIVDKVIGGKFGNGKERFDALTKAGYNYCEVQNKVNEKLGNSFRYTKEQIAAQDKLVGAQKKTTESTKELTKADKDRIKQVAKLTEEEAKALGYTDEQIAAFKELGDAAKKLGMPLDEFIDNLDEINGRWLMIESFKNIGKSLISVFKAIGKAWQNVFPPKSLEERSEKIFDLLAAFHRFTRGLIPTEEAANNLRRVFEGLFAALDVVKTITMGPLTVAFKLVKAVLGAFNIDVLGALAYVGDMIVKFRNWFKSVLDFNGVFEKLTGLIKKFVDPIKEFFKNIDTSSLSAAAESVKEFIGSLDIKESVANNFKKIIEGLRAAFELGKTLWSMSLVAGLKILSAVLSLFGTDLVELGGKIADWIIRIRDAVKEHTIFIGYVDKLAKIIHTLIEGVEKCVKAFLKLEPVQRIIQGVKDAFKGLLGGIGELNIDGFINGLKAGIDKVVAWIEGLKNSENIGKDLIEGIVNGISSGITNLVNVLMNLGKTIINTICEVLGIHSPSTEGVSIGQNMILGIIEGMLSLITGLGRAIKNIALSLLGSLKDTGATMMSAVLWGISSIFTKNPIWNIGAALFNLFAAMGGDTAKGFIEGVSSGFSGVIKCISNLASKIISAFKEMLGIHSPSRVFMMIGKFLIAGLIIGIVGQKTGLFGAISNVFGKGLDSIKNMFSTVWEWLQNLPPIKWEYLLGIAALAGVVITIKKILDIMDNFSQAAKGVGKMCSGIGKLADAFAEKLNPQQSKAAAFADTALKLAISIGILAAAVWVLSKVETGPLWSAVGAVAALATVVVVMAAIMNGLGKKMTIDLEKISGLILSLSISMLLLAGVAKIIGGMTWGELGKAGAGLAGLAVIIAGLIWATKLAAKGGKHFDKIGTLIRKIATSMLFLSIAIKIMGTMEWSELARAGAAIGGLGIFVAGLIWATKLAGNKINSASTLISKIGISMVLLGVALRLMGGMQWDALGRAGAAIGGLGIFVAGLIWATKLAGPEIDKVGITILKIAAAMSMLAWTAKLIATMSWGDMGKAAVGLAGLGAIVAGLIWITKLAPEREIAKVTSTLLAMSFCIGILGITATVLSMISLPGLIKGVAAVSVLAAMMAVMVKATRGASEVKGSIMMMAVAIGVMAAAVAALSFIDTKSLITATACMGALMGLFALIVKSTQYAQKSVGSLVVMTVAIGLMAGCIFLLAKGLPTDAAIGAAGALAILMLAMSGVLIILGTFNSTVGKAMIGIVALTAMAVPLLAFVGILALMSNVQNAVTNATALTVLATAMTLLLIPLTLVGTLMSTGLPLLGVLALTTMAVPLLAFVGILAIMEGLNNAQKNIDILTALMGKMTIMLVALAIVGPLAMVGVQAMAGLVALMVVVGALAVGIGALMEKFPQIESFLNKGIPILEKLAYALGSFIGNIVSGFMNGVAEGLPRIGQLLSEFMTNAMPFIAGIKMVDSSVLKNVGILAASIVALTAADLIAGVGSFLSGGSSFATLGAELSAFMINAMPFIMGARMIDPATMTGVKSLAEAILILTAADVLDGLTSWFTGGSSLAKFGEELAAFGPHMRTYADAVKGIDSEAVSASATAAKTLAEMANALPNEGGLVGWFAGENDMSVFGTQLVSFGKSLKQYAVAVEGLNAEAVKISVNAATALSEMAASIPNLGGMVTWFTGDNDLATFGTKLVSFGTSLKTYSVAVTGMAIEPINISVQAGKALAGLAESIPNLGGVVSWFTGDNSLSTFGTQIVSFGTALKMYSLAVAGLAIEPINNSIAAARSLAKLAEIMPSDGGFWSWFKDDTVSLSDFGKEIIPFGDCMAKYSEKVSGINMSAINGSVSAARNLVSFIKSISNLEATGVTTFVSALSTLGKAAVDKFIKAFTGAKGNLTKVGSDMVTAVQNGITSKSSVLISAVAKLVNTMMHSFKSRNAAFKSMGEKLMVALMAGVKSKYSTVSKGLSDIAVKMADKIKAKRTNWNSAGKYLVEGFAAGIKANTFKAEAKARAMALAALEAAQDALGIESPSKVARDEVGKYFVEGLAEGITEDMSAEEAAAKKAQNIVDAFKTEFDKLDTDVTTADLEYELWSKTHGVNASEEALNAAEINNLTKNYKIQTERVALAQGEYDVTLKAFGKTAEETQEAYNKLLREQIDLADLSSKISELQNQALSNTPETFTAYADYLSKNAAKLKEFGMSMEDIMAVASQNSGYDPNKASGDTEVKLEDVGISYGEAMNSGIQGTSDQVLATTSVMVQTCTERMKELQPEWVTGGAYLVEGFIKGIDDNIQAAANKAAEMAKKAYEAAMAAIGVASPSKAFAELGMYADLGFAKGLSDYADTAANASAEMATGALSGLKNVVGRLTGTIADEVGAQATITPILDLSNIQNGVSQLKGLFAGRSAELAASASVSVNSTSNMYDYIDQMQKINDARDSEIVGALGELRGDFGNLINAISNLGIQLDDGTMVGKIIGKIDTGLGRIANHKGRGN